MIVLPTDVAVEVAKTVAVTVVVGVGDGVIPWIMGREIGRWSTGCARAVVHSGEKRNPTSTATTTANKIRTTSRADFKLNN